jgi:hypothetical protein
MKFGPSEVPRPVMCSEPAASPVDGVWLVKRDGAAGQVVSGGFGDAPAAPLPPAIVVPTTAAVAPGAAMKILSLDDMVASQIHS